MKPRLTEYWCGIDFIEGADRDVSIAKRGKRKYKRL